MSVEARYRAGGIIFGCWQIGELVRTDPGANAAFFPLMHTDDPNTLCALKVITLLQAAGQPGQLTREQQADFEGRKAACKEHATASIQRMHQLQICPHTVDYYDFTFVDWQDEAAFGCDLLVRTEYLQDLRSLLQGGHNFTESEAINLGSDLCTALDACHSSGILHRSIRPENIYVTAEGCWKLGDTVMTDVQPVLPAPGIVGPQYCAPEQFQGQAYPESDLYSLGLVLYELTNGGVLPFAVSAQDVDASIRTRLQGNPLPAPRQASPALTAVIFKACQPNPANRPHSAGEFLAGLHQAAPVAPVVQPKPTQAQHTASKPQKIHNSKNNNLTLILCIVLITVLALLVIGGGIFFYLHIRNNENAPATTGQPQIQNTVSSTPETIQPEAPAGETTESTEPTERTMPESHKYYSCYNPYTEFVLPESHTRYYAPGELKELSSKELTVALAEIAARHGAVPTEPELADYFSYLSWYVPSNDAYALNDIEQANALLLSTRQKYLNGELDRYSNRFLAYMDSDGYFLPAGSSRRLTSADLEGLSEDELVLGRNEIFARHGFIFSAVDVLEYFYCTNWYVPKYPGSQFSYDLFSSDELMNLELILVYEEIVDYANPDRDNPYVPYLTGNGYILPNSSNTRLQERDLEGLDRTQLYLAEQEIYARHGLSFEEEDLLHYFLECHWYHIEIAASYKDRVELSSTERANLELIRKAMETR